MSFSNDSYYAAVRSTPHLVDRKPILQQIKQAVDDPNPDAAHIFYITGHGGIGKTFLLLEVLRRFREGGAWADDRILAAQEVIDLYHLDNHTIEGLSGSIQQALRPGLGYFADYQRERRRLIRSRPELDTLRDRASQSKLMADAFLDDLTYLMQDYRLVLVIDTAEVLLYEMDQIQSLLGLAAEGVAVHSWLIKDLLPKLTNAVVLIAGRPKPKRLRQELQDALGDKLIECELGPLDVEDSLVYFDLVAKAAEQSGQKQDLDAAARIEAIPEETRRVIHHYAGGRPILLSLLLDYFVVADRLLPALGDLPEEASSRSDEELETIQAQLEADIVRAIQETGRPADEAIRTLGWAQRGLDASMLARVAGITLEKALDMLESLKGLSFIKVRPDGRVFLQDEMYALLQKHVLAHLPEPFINQVYQSIVSYYEERIDSLREELAKLREQSTDDEARVMQIRRDLLNAIVERIHYLLRQDSTKGFWAYFEAAEEAFRARHEEMDMVLRSELLNFLENASIRKREDIIDRATWDAGVRWVKRCNNKSDYDNAIAVAMHLREQVGELLERLAPLAEAELDVWEGWARIYASQDLKKAEELLNRAVQIFTQLDPADEYERWQKSYLLGTAYNNLGYLLRNRGRYLSAIEQYRHAIPYWQALKNEVELANTLNNLSWALAEVGRFELATHLCEDALSMRTQMGPRYPIALSMNTLAMIQIRADQPHRAARMARQALAVFDELALPRGEGMATRALAEALRRQSTLPQLYSPEEQVALLQEAEVSANRSVSVFRETVREKSRRIEALIELGCINRSWAYLQMETGVKSERATRELDEGAVAALRAAAKEAREQYPHLELDALVNLAWLHYRMGRPGDGKLDKVDLKEKKPENATRVIKEAFAILDTDYFIVASEGKPQVTSPTAFNWVQIGKAYLLLGLIHKDMFDQSYREKREQEQSSEDALVQTQEHLVNAVRQFTLSLAYYELYAFDFRDVRRARDLLYAKLKALNLAEKALVRETVEQVEQSYQLEQPSPLRKFLDDTFGLWSFAVEA